MRRVPGGQPLEQRLKIGGIAALIFVVLLSVLSTYYTVEPEEVGVVTRFGDYERTVPPGLHFKLPFGIEDVHKVKVGRIEKEEFGFRTERAGVVTEYSREEFDDESLILTGDLNLVDLNWTVQYKVREDQAEDFLFNVREPIATLRALSESVMRAVAGDRSVTELINVAQREVEQQAEVALQEILDGYGSGIRIERIELRSAFPPQEVMSAYTRVEEAGQEKETIIQEAQRDYNQVIPQAQGLAAKTISEAEGYRLDRVNRAKGEAERFTRILAEYAKAPEVTRQRLYLEAMAEVLGAVDRKVVIDGDLEGLLPLLELGRKEDGR